MSRTIRALVVLVVVGLGVTACGGTHRNAPTNTASRSSSDLARPPTTAAGVTPGSPTVTPSASVSTLRMVPRLDHIVIAVLENHSFDEVVDRGDAPFLNSLANTGAVMTQSFAVSHPSEPNYLALFSGSTQGLTDD
jgi:hypothetical protein